jgi:hypothetical protein
MSNWAFWCCYPVPSENCACTCFCSESSPSSYIASWPFGDVATFKKEVVINFCTTPQCGLLHNDYNYHIELTITKVGGMTVTKVPGGLENCGCYYEGFGVFTVTGFVEISAPLDSCGPCADFLRLININKSVEGCLQVQCGSSEPCSTMSGPSAIRHQLQLCDVQISNATTMVEHDWEDYGNCPEVAVGVRLLGAVLQWTSVCEPLDDLFGNNRAMTSQENTGVIICDNTFEVPNTCYGDLLRNREFSGNGSFAVMFTEEYSAQDPAPDNCSFQIPATTLGLIPIAPYAGFTGSLLPFGAKCQSHSVQVNSCTNVTMECGINPATYV